MKSNMKQVRGKWFLKLKKNSEMGIEKAWALYPLQSTLERENGRAKDRALNAIAVEWERERERKHVAHVIFSLPRNGIFSFILQINLSRPQKLFSYFYFVQ